VKDILYPYPTTDELDLDVLTTEKNGHALPMGGEQRATRQVWVRSENEDHSDWSELDITVAARLTPSAIKELGLEPRRLLCLLLCGAPGPNSVRASTSTAPTRTLWPSQGGCIWIDRSSQGSSSCLRWCLETLENTSTVSWDAALAGPCLLDVAEAIPNDRCHRAEVDRLQCDAPGDCRAGALSP